MPVHIFLYLSLGVWGTLCVPLPDIVDIDNFMDITEINKDLDLNEGDIMEDNHRSYILGEQEWTFPIPYELDANLDMNAKGVVLRALEQFRLKTCVDFKPRTNESHYISVEKDLGCWSYVGMQSLKQTLSIGTHCDHIAVVEHEFLHALGFLHEQSRYDREDFISINWDNIVEGLGYNFDKYGKDITSTMGTPYDYWSVMHYSQNAFSSNKGRTIITKDARFQDVIGQHLEMSSYDALELNRQYNCNDSISFLDHCRFDEGMCEMSSMGWQRVRQADGGPQSDHSNLGMESQGAFMHSSTNHNSQGESAHLISRKMTPQRSCKIQCLQFFYYHSGTESDQLNIWIREFDDVSDTEGTRRLMSQVSGSSADYWQLHHVPLNATKPFQVEFEACKGTGESSGGFSVDDINLSETECPHHTWHIRDFEKTLNDSVKKPLLLSPKYYSIDGYRFQIMVNLSDDHFGAFFHLVSGKNDDELQWPCPWRQVSIEALDQNSHIQHRMSAQISLTTDPRQLSRNVFVWDNPRHVGTLDGTPERDYVTGKWGYRVFMTYRDLRSREFLKGGDMFLHITMQDISSLEHSHSLPCPNMPLQTLTPVTQDLD